MIAPPKILIVEDDEPNQMVTSFWLEEFGYCYELAASGEEAVEKFKTGRFSVILMDVKMHKMSGFETTKIIREIEKQKKLRPAIIIAFTAYACVDDRANCLKNGMDEYFSKPIDYPLLKTYLSKHITPPAK